MGRPGQTAGRNVSRRTRCKHKKRAPLATPPPSTTTGHLHCCHRRRGPQLRAPLTPLCRRHCRLRCRCARVAAALRTPRSAAPFVSEMGAGGGGASEDPERPAPAPYFCSPQGGPGIKAAAASPRRASGAKGEAGRRGGGGGGAGRNRNGASPPWNGGGRGRGGGGKVLLPRGRVGRVCSASGGHCRDSRARWTAPRAAGRYATTNTTVAPRAVAGSRPRAAGSVRRHQTTVGGGGGGPGRWPDPARPRRPNVTRYSRRAATTNGRAQSGRRFRVEQEVLLGGVVADTGVGNGKRPSIMQCSTVHLYSTQSFKVHQGHAPS